ncbi:MAG: DUF4388 domain-containing protein [Myxococcota bacterium]
MLVVGETAARRADWSQRLASHFEPHSAALRALPEKEAFEVALIELTEDVADLNAILAIDVPAKVVLAHRLSPSSYHALRERGVVEILDLEASTEQVVDALQRALGRSSGVLGFVHGLSLVDLLQMYHYGRATLSLELFAPRRGRIDMYEGDVFYVEYDALEGAAAFKRILGTDQTTVQSSTLYQVEVRNIEEPFEALVLDSLRLLDEEGIAAPLPSALPSALPGPVEMEEELHLDQVEDFIERSFAPMCLRSRAFWCPADGDTRAIYGGSDDDEEWESIIGTPLRQMPNVGHWWLRTTANDVLGVIHLEPGDSILIHTPLAARTAAGTFHAVFMRTVTSLSARLRDATGSVPPGAPLPSPELDRYGRDAASMLSGLGVAEVGVRSAKREWGYSDGGREAAFDWHLCELVLDGVVADTWAGELTTTGEDAQVWVRSPRGLAFGQRLASGAAIFATTPSLGANFGMVAFRLRAFLELCAAEGNLGDV